MTVKTLHAENRGSKKKLGEIERFIEFMTSLNLNPEQIQKDTGVSVRTVTNCIYENNPLGSKILRQCHLKYGLSIDWVLSGEGSMFATAGNITEPGKHYETDPNKLAAANSKIVKTLSVEINEWLECATDDERVWLELSIKQLLLKNWPPIGR